MKKIIFTLITIALLAFSKDAICGPIIFANCPDFNGSPGYGCIDTQDQLGFVDLTPFDIILRLSSELAGTDFYVYYVATDASHNVLVEKGSFVNYLYENSFIYRHYVKLAPGTQSYNFGVYLYSESGQFLKSFSPGGFNICQSNNKLSSADYEEVKNISNENFDFQSFSIQDNLDEYKVYPNPIEKDFTVEYEVTQTEPVTFQIFDIEGRSIYRTDIEHQNTGQYTKQFNDLNLPKGVYFCRFQTNKSQKTIKITKL